MYYPLTKGSAFFLSIWSPSRSPGADLQHGTIETDRVYSALYNSFERKQTGFNKTHEMLAEYNRRLPSGHDRKRPSRFSLRVGSGCTQANEMSMSIFMFWAWATCDSGTLEAFHTARNCLENTGIWGINANRDVMPGFGTVSQRSKLFRLVSEQRKTVERDFRFWPCKKWYESQKRKEAGSWKGRKEAFLPHPLTFLLLLSFFAWSWFSFLGSLLRNRT